MLTTEQDSALFSFGFTDFGLIQNVHIHNPLYYWLLAHKKEQKVVMNIIFLFMPLTFCEWVN